MYKRWVIASPVNKEYQALQGNINTLTFNLDDLWLSQNVSLMYNRWVIANQVNKEALIFPWSTWYSLFTGLAITHLLYMRLKFCEYQRSSGLKVKITMNNKNNIYLQIPINDMKHSKEI
jgi:hypothetical protein